MLKCERTDRVSSAAALPRRNEWRILFITAEPLRPRQAGTTHVQEVVKCLRARGHSVVLTSSPHKGLHTHTSLLRRLSGYLTFWVRSFRHIRGAQLIYARAHPANYPVVLAARLLRKPVVQEVNGTYLDVVLTHTWLSPFLKAVSFLQRSQYRMSNALIVVTAGLGDWARDQAPATPISVIPNAANCSIFCPRPTTPSKGRDYAIFFGSFAPWHGVRTMLAAVDSARWPQDMDLLLVGDGPLKPIVETSAAENPHIRSQHALPQDELAELIRGANVGLVPVEPIGGRKLIGASPLKLYEMLACGIPVIATDLPGQADLVRSLNGGLIIRPGDPDALAASVAAIRSSGHTPQVMRGVASVIKDQHSWEVRARQIEGVMEQVIQTAN
jgi:glycosyltransferase involved in cell wall biosynthesis